MNELQIMKSKESNVRELLTDVYGYNGGPYML